MLKISRHMAVLASLLVITSFHTKALQAATIDLVFSTFITSQCAFDCTYFDNSPIEGTHTVSVDTSVIETYASTTAYNNTIEFNERLVTNIINGGYSELEYEQLTVNLDQIYTAYGNGNSSMSTGLFVSEDSRSITPFDVEYTGSLPPSYQPNSSNAFTISNNQIAFYGTLDQGLFPLFTDPVEENIPAMLNGFLGMQLGFSTNQNTVICQDYDELSGSCISSIGSSYYSENGYAYLDSVSVSSVPVPSAIWLFLSGIVAMVSLARRK